MKSMKSFKWSSHEQVAVIRVALHDFLRQCRRRFLVLGARPKRRANCNASRDANRNTSRNASNDCARNGDTKRRSK
jgi:hypothetical protein